MAATPEWDSGRQVMQTVMARKRFQWDEAARCKAASTCPERLMRPLPGAFQCDSAGLAGSMPCKNVDQLSFVSFGKMGHRSAQGNDVWGWTDPETGDEYAIMGFSTGTAFVRVTDPKNPVPVGYIKSATDESPWRDIKVVINHAYIVAEAKDHGLQVFDLIRLRGVEELQTFTADAVNNDFGQAHNVVANENMYYIYVVGANISDGYPKTCRGGLMIFDVSNPLHPTFVSCFGNDGYVHDAQCVNYRGPDIRYVGSELCFCYNDDSLTIVDVTNKNDMRMIAKTGYANSAYTHQGWLTEDHQLLLLDDEFDEHDTRDKYTKTYIFDVRDLENPQLKSVYRASETSIDHNQYIAEDFVFQANYESGLRILHINRQTEALSLVAYFDVFPSSTTAEFNGAWSVFPYFKSGTVVISSIDYGLFVVRPNWEGINKLVASGEIMSHQTRFRKLLAATHNSVCPGLSEIRPCSALPDC